MQLPDAFPALVYRRDDGDFRRLPRIHNIRRRNASIVNRQNADRLYLPLATRAAAASRNTITGRSACTLTINFPSRAATDAAAALSAESVIATTAFASH